MEILDLSTRNVDSHDGSVVSKDISSVSTSLLTDEKFLNLNHRLSIFPLYPTSNTQALSYPLLTNMPYYHLSQADRIRRHSSAFKPAFNILNLDPTISSSLREKYQFFYSDLIERLKIDITLLDFNYTRLEKYMKALIDQHIRVFDLRPHEIQRIDEKEYPLALEFFLQFDINMFYMKTCLFRFARPRSLNEGLFCLQEPEARYELAACEHREHGNRIMHEFLLGQSNIMQDSPQGKTKQILRKDRMNLYQHSARCPAAMQIFLDAYSQYWRFIPMTFEESEKSEQRNINDSLLSDEVDCKLRSKEKCRICVEAVPKPPRGLIFSNRQILLQAQYFQKKRDKIVPDGIIDLYNATVVAVYISNLSSIMLSSSSPSPPPGLHHRRRSLNNIREFESTSTNSTCNNITNQLEQLNVHSDVNITTSRTTTQPRESLAEAELTDRLRAIINEFMIRPGRHYHNHTVTHWTVDHGNEIHYSIVIKIRQSTNRI
ncbi:unnamed protein product [Adineta steineri]|uniref:Uncharacterized protein n=1 Tax=Adineta steineri TaxID=433720 RepID=A0A819R8N0_9BILA|nr:unnamed protein product [Adineta steineri]